jgi:hypothetical protein
MVSKDIRGDRKTDVTAWFVFDEVLSSYQPG